MNMCMAIHINNKEKGNQEQGIVLVLSTLMPGSMKNTILL